MSQSATALGRIRSVDYTVIFARDIAAMRGFYQNIMRFPVERELGPDWTEHRIGANILALARPHAGTDDLPTPKGSASLQLAFRVAPDDVNRCELELRAAGVPIVSPATDQPWGHRTLFFRDPDGNLLEIYADI
ncbi:MAG: VOC family protein [Hyphomonadaceae bacterium]|nr:VOC family protein [Hyphomonadaceae bacterium]